MFNYFNGSLSQGFVALYSGRMIQFIGFGLIGLFLPIYLFQIFNQNTEIVIIYFLVGHLLYALILPLGIQYLNKIGLRRSLRISVFFATSYYLSLALISYSVSFIFLSVIMVVLFRTFFWLPFHTDFAKFTDRKNRGKSVSLMWATNSFLGVAMPVIAGFLIGTLGYNYVYFLAIMIYLTSLIPFTALPRTKERYSWGYLETFEQFFAKKNRRLVLANIANGAENCVGIIIWPIFIFQLLKGNYFAVGAISSLIIFATVILQLLVGKYADIFNKRKMIHWGSIFYASGWLAKVFVLTSFQIFIVGTYHNFTQIFKDTPFDALNYELLADHGHLVDEYTALKEIAIQIGKVLMLAIILLVVMNFGLAWAFALAAIASLFINFL